MYGEVEFLFYVLCMYVFRTAVVISGCTNLAARPRDLDVEEVQTRHTRVLASAHETRISLLWRPPTLGVHRNVAQGTLGTCVVAVRAQTIPFVGHLLPARRMKAWVVAVRSISQVTLLSKIQPLFIVAAVTRVVAGV